MLGDRRPSGQHFPSLNLRFLNHRRSETRWSLESTSAVCPHFTEKRNSYGFLTSFSGPGSQASQRQPCPGVENRTTLPKVTQIASQWQD